jgi:hypothetical protein
MHLRRKKTFSPRSGEKICGQALDRINFFGWKTPSSAELVPISGPHATGSRINMETTMDAKDGKSHRPFWVKKFGGVNMKKNRKSQEINIPYP